ncbi:hypothetical protein SprV_0401705200 [Sparganum proliferum]
MAQCVLPHRKWILILALLGITKIIYDVYFTSERVAIAVETVKIQASPAICNVRWISLSEITRDGTYDLSLRYCVDPHLPVTRYDSFPLDLISKTGGARNISFAEMAQIKDSDWKRPINLDVFLLYPQGFALREVIQKYRETGLVPEPPINSPTIRLLKVSTSVCPPEGINATDLKYNHDLVVIVKSAVYNFDDRQNFRRLYAHLRNASSVKLPYRIGIVFMVGLPTSASSNSFQRDGFNISLPGRAGNSLVNIGSRRAQIHSRLEQEMREHDDLIVGDFEDTYYNLSLKMHHTFVWAARFCLERPAFLFLDDDFGFNEKRLLAVLATLPVDWRRTVSISNIRWNSSAMRPSDSALYRRWALSKREIPWPVHAPHSNGYFYMLGYDHVADLTLAMFYTKSIPIDDVWLGLVMHRIGLHFSLPTGITSSMKHQVNVSGYIVLPLNSLLTASRQKKL